MGAHITHSPHLIDKEKVAQLAFPEEDVLSSANDQKKRWNDLRNAHELGDLAQYKVKITFEDVEGAKVVETTVWDLTSKDVVLKYGVTVPVHRVVRVIFP